MERLFPPLIAPLWTRAAEDGELLEKTLIVNASSAILGAALLWGATFLFYGEYPAGLLSLVYAAFTLTALFAARAQHRYRWYLPLQFSLGLLIPFTHMIMLGGFWNSSAVMVWSMVIPIGALVFFGRQASVPWWILSVLLLCAAALLEPSLQRPSLLPPFLIRSFFVLNIASVSGIVFITLRYFLHRRDEAYLLLHREEQRSERLLLNVLPASIAAQLKQEERVIADAFPAASILFADIAGFTSLSARLPPIEMVNTLNEIFSFFDTLVEKYQVEKIRTIGDNYMVVAGAPTPQPDHARRLANLALEMQAYLAQRAAGSSAPLNFRIGMNSGPVIGGVIGRKKFVYDVWGEAVNLASRMEAYGVPGSIQVAQQTYGLLEDEFVLEPRGEIEIRGVGRMQTWFLKEVKHGSSS